MTHPEKKEQTPRLLTYRIWLLIAIFVFGALLRLWQLGSIPTGLSNDESGYIYSAYSIWKTGHDVSGSFLPLSINLDNSFSPVYIYATAPFVGLLGLSPFAGRLPFALISIACLPIFFFIVKEWFANEKLALLATFLLAISPWHLMASRIAIDADFALFFYLLGIYLFIHYQDSKKQLWSLLAFFLGFYSYHATKLFLLFLIPVLFLYYRKELLRNKKITALFVTGLVCILLSFVYISKTQSVTRQAVLLWNNGPIASSMVNGERQYTTAPEKVRPLFSNKLSIYMTMFRNNYLEAFSPEFLLLYGEPSGLKRQFSLLTSGELYVIEGLFLLIGLYMLFHHRLQKLPLWLLLISPLPAALSADQTFFNRSIMMLPFLVMIVAVGIYYLIGLAGRNKKIFIGGVIAIYAVLFIQYQYVYYFRYPLYSSEAWFEQSRIISQYVQQNSNEYKHVYIDNAGPMFLMQYGIYNHVEPKVISAAWKKYPKATIGNISFVDQYCNEKMPISFYHYPKGSLLIAPGDCYKEAPAIEMIRDKAEYLHVLWRIIKI